MNIQRMCFVFCVVEREPFFEFSCLCFFFLPSLGAGVRWKRQLLSQSQCHNSLHTIIWLAASHSTVIPFLMSAGKMWHNRFESPWPFNAPRCIFMNSLFDTLDSHKISVDEKQKSFQSDDLIWRLIGCGFHLSCLGGFSNYWPCSAI